MCYYGEVVCSSEKCPPLKIGCHRINSEERCCGKIICVEADESPTVVLDRADATAPSQRQSTVSPDPFRDVIKTEPAPDLPSLIEDMIPYLVERGITTPRSTSMTPSVPKTSVQKLADDRLQHSPNFDFTEQVPLIRSPVDYGQETVDSSFLSKYGGNRKITSKDTVSLTYDFKNQILDRKPVENPATGILSYDRTPLTKLNRTNNDTKNDFHRGDITKQKFVKQDVIDDRNFTSKMDNHTESNNTLNEDERIAEDAIFSLDSVLELLFSSNNSSSIKLETTKTPDVSFVGGEREDQEILVASSTSTERLTEETETVETSSKVLDNEIPMSMGSLLKLAGCNIYGRMYRVGRIITELSSPCMECRCTEIGVQCKQLEC